MKFFILLASLLMGSVAFAEKDSVVFPQVSNFGTSVQITIWNHTDRSISCSGQVYLNYMSGFRESEYFFDYVSARFTSYKHIYARRMNDRVVNVTHRISCF